MTQVTWTPNWIDDSFFELDQSPKCKIVAARVEQRDDGRKDIIVEIASKAAHVRMSVYGENLRHLIDKAGGDTDGWVGKFVTVHQIVKGDKKRRILSVVQP